MTKYHDPKSDEMLEIRYLSLLRQTSAAWQFDVVNEDMDELRIWLPKSRCELQEEQKIVMVPRWLVEKNRLTSKQEAERDGAKDDLDGDLPW